MRNRSLDVWKISHILYRMEYLVKRLHLISPFLLRNTVNYLAHPFEFTLTGNCIRDVNKTKWNLAFIWIDGAVCFHRIPPFSRLQAELTDPRSRKTSYQALLFCSGKFGDPTNQRTSRLGKVTCRRCEGAVVTTHLNPWIRASAENRTCWTDSRDMGIPSRRRPY